MGYFSRPAQTPFAPRAPASDGLRTLSAQLLLLDDANPVFGTPKSWGVKDALAKIPYIASFGSFVDDTSAHADLILPDHSFLESWTDSLPESGSLVAVASAAGPVMKPLYQTKSTPDVLIEVAGKLKSPIAMPWKTYDEAIKAGFDKISATAWDDVAKQGGHWESEVESRKSKVESRESQVGSRGSQVVSRYEAARFDGDPAAVSRSTSSPMRRRISTMAPPRISPGCRRCRIR